MLQQITVLAVKGLLWRSPLLEGRSQTPMLNTAAQLRETSYPVPPSCSLTKPAGKIAAFLSAHV